MKSRPSPTTVVRSGPLTWIQQWHWFEHTIPSPRRVNPTPLADHCHVPPPATLADIDAALEFLTTHHEVLRTTIDPLRPVQHVHRVGWAPPPVDHLELPLVDASTLEAATAALAARPIDPERNPPWLARVLIEAGRPRAVVVAAHHVLIDGWGLAVLISRLHDRLRDGGGPAHASPHPLDAIAAQHPERARATELEWLARLAGNPTGVLAPFGGDDTGTGRHRVQHRSVPAHDDLERVARRYRASPEVVMLAALAHDVATRTGEHRFLASVVVSNRTRAALRDSLGVLALTVPVQIDLRPGAAFGEVVTSVAAASTAAYRHGQFRPAELVAAQARMDRRRGIVAVPTIEYNSYSWPRDYLVPVRHAPPTGSATWIRSAPDEPCETLYVDVSRDQGFVTIDVTVGDHLLDAGQAQALPARLCDLLRVLAEGADCPVPARALSSPAAGWWRAPQGWVRLASVKEALLGHPGVLDVTVKPSGEGDKPGLVAYARVTPDITPGDLHRHVLDQVGEVTGLLAPNRYLLSPAAQSTAGLAIPLRPPSSDAERALADAVADAGSLSSPEAVDMNSCLADHGVTLVAIPRLLDLLHQSGYTGIAPDELAGPASLGHLAAALDHCAPRAHRGGEISP